MDHRDTGRQRVGTSVGRRSGKRVYVAQPNAGSVVANAEARRDDTRWLGCHGHVIKCRRALLARRTGITLRYQEPAAPKERHAERRATKRGRPAARVILMPQKALIFR